MAMKPRAMQAASKKKTMMRGGGMTQANAGASMKPTQKGTPKPAMMRGGMAKKAKMMRGGMASKAGKASGGMTKKK